ncbi:rho guanine nucleotide exchange factor 2 isoform X3 [Sphaerodactylus townsendi]|uniref:rho guanine nucleotide exchange factor 2 isoform X3 n=1 Tax=Sphaerodactylus townsendi TaxID=933632 RepID=UPI0020270857|nr:rho guanine nucleotide exchange factor 2 isoform X3 [Sphaerodactylus townsendi]
MNGSASEVFLNPYGGTPHPPLVQKHCCLSVVEPCSSAVEDWETADAEEEDDCQFLNVQMRRSGNLRCSAHAHDSFRRHSWEPGKVLDEPDFHQRSVSLKGLAPDEIDSSAVQMDRHSRGRMDPRRIPIIRSSDEMESVLSQDEEDDDLEVAQEHSMRMQAYRASPGSVCTSLSKSVSMSVIDSYPDADEISLYTDAASLGNGYITGSCGQLDTTTGEAEDKVHPQREGTTLGRTFSFFKKMTGKSKNREKERMKEKEKDARYTNGHLFTSITVSGMTMCFACNKSITAKEALSCPTCNVTIHNRCKDTLPNCTKVKQKQQKAALLKNNTALQSVSLRSKTTIRERPSSAIYPSESFRQTLLGSRRGRPTLSLSKSVSTTNIAGTFNDESPLGLRRILSQSTDSLNMRNRTLSVESLIDEGAEVMYNQLMSDFEMGDKDFEADSWSLAVDNNFLQQHKKEVMKRQDVIYELIQTELHHVQTLKIMTNLFRKGMLEDLQMDPTVVQSMFPCVDELSEIHDRFLVQLLERRKESLATDSNKNFVINRLGDILVQQFSGTSAEQMKKAYSEFCSRHSKAVKLYKELFTRDKKFQQFIRRLTRSTVLRRHGVQECILLVTQRITKYPGLIDRILQNSKGNEVDQRDLSIALTQVKELLSTIDQEVHDYEKNARLQEIYGRLDVRAKADLAKGSFCSEELLRRKLVHDGSMLWKTAAGRFKDVLVVLMTDVLIFLQEKDQKYNFPSLDKRPVISLENLIVRDVANQEKGMFLISAAPLEMYEVHTASREDRNTWMKLIQQTVKLCPNRADFPLIETENEASLRKLKDKIQQRDREITGLLEDKVGLFADILALQSGSVDSPLPCMNSRTLFRAESSDTPHGEKLIQEAIREVEFLKDLFVGPSWDRDQNHTHDANGCSSPNPNNTTNGETGSINGSLEFNRVESDSNQRDGNGNQLQQKAPQEEVLQRLRALYSLLHGLQAAVAHQDTLLEIQVQEAGERRERLIRTNSCKEAAASTADKQATDFSLLQKQHALLQEELSRCRQLYQEKAQEATALEVRLRESEQERARLEQEVEEIRKQTVTLRQPGAIVEAIWARKGAEPRRRSLPAGDALYQSFTPPQQSRGGDPLSPSCHSFQRTFVNCQRDEIGYHGISSRLQEGDQDLEVLSEEEGVEMQHTPPSSPRDFLKMQEMSDFPKMQDIPEEVESSQELNVGDSGTSYS